MFQDDTFLKIKFVGVAIVQLICLYVFCWFGEKIAGEVISKNLK